MPALPGTHNWLASPQTAIPTPPINKTLYLVTIMEVRNGLLHVCLHTPRGPHPCACGTDSESCTQVPPFIQFAQRGCQSTVLELRGVR
eukprot:1153281-Pelagomonas_calceolata.AAC.5